MNKVINCIMLIDDNPDDNFFHERIIRKNNVASLVVIKQSGEEALEFLKKKEEHFHEHPDLIFLDINMPGMNGWEFLQKYNDLEKDYKSRAVVVMLTSSENPEDIKKAKSLDISFPNLTKPLTKEMLEVVLSKYFPKQ